MTRCELNHNRVQSARHHCGDDQPRYGSTRASPSEPLGGCLPELLLDFRKLTKPLLPLRGLEFGLSGHGSALHASCSILACFSACLFCSSTLSLQALQLEQTPMAATAFSVVPDLVGSRLGEVVPGGPAAASLHDQSWHCSGDQTQLHGWNRSA